MARLKGVAKGTTVEAAPSHDGSPTYAAYNNIAPGENRPLFALRIYDTTAQAASDDHVRHVAKVIFENTWWRRSGTGREAPDRVEVVGLHVSADVTDDDERAQKCREHQIAEVAARKSAGLRDWYLPGTFQTDSYLFGINVITYLDPGWEEAIKSTDPLKRLRLEKSEEKKTDPFGTYLSVNWGVGEYVEICEEEGEELWPEMSVTLNRIIYLDVALSGARHKIEWFYNQYVSDGGLDREFELH